MTDQDEEELGPIGSVVVGVMLAGLGYFLTGANEAVLAIGPVPTGIGLPIVGWVFVVLGVLSIAGGVLEYRERDAGPEPPAGRANRADPGASREAEPQRGRTQPRSGEGPRPRQEPRGQVQQHRAPQGETATYACPECNRSVAAGTDRCPNCGVTLEW